MNRLLWLLTLTVMAAVSLPFLVQKGMFLDGIVYAGISHNLALGRGTMWVPYYSEASDQQFFSHPPLALWLEAGYFRLFGSAWWVEKLYSLTTFLASAGLLALLWRRMAEERYRAFSWLPVLLWTVTPLIMWTFQNNMLENTVSVWGLLAGYGFVSFVRRRWWGWLLLGGAGVFAGVLTKGPTALFPLAIFPIYWVLYKKEYSFLRLLGDSLAAGGLLAVQLVALLAYPPALHYARRYLAIQLVPSLSSEVQAATGSSPGMFLLMVLAEVAIPLGFLAIWLMVNRIARKEAAFSMARPALLALLTALSGMLPILLALKLRAFYIVPALPFFALGIGLLLAPLLAPWVAQAGATARTVLAGVVFAGMIGVGWATAEKRHAWLCDPETQQDVLGMCKVLPSGTRIHMPGQYAEDFSMLAYLVRYGQISVDYVGAHPWRIFPTDSSLAHIDSLGYAVDTSLIHWRLARQKNAEQSPH